MKRILPQLICTLALVPFATLLAKPDTQVFSLTLTAPAEPLKSGAELHLQVKVTNTWNRILAFVRSPGSIPLDNFYYRIEVRDERGQSAPPSLYERNLEKSTRINEAISQFAVWLQPGESYLGELDITKEYDLSRPGKYTIQVQRAMPPGQKLGDGKVTSNAVAVTVIPPHTP